MRFQLRPKGSDISLFTAGYFVALFLLLFQTSVQSATHSLVIPDDIGHVSATSKSAKQDSSSPRIILIQDAHQNIEAQRHIAAILKQLTEQYGLNFVLIEGGSGDVGMSRYRRISTPAGRKELAEHFLKTGMLSGAEYLDMTSDKPLLLWGIEDQKLYDANFNVFLLQQQKQSTLEKQLANLDQAVARLKDEKLSAGIKNFEAQAALFRKDQLPLKDFVASLKQLSDQLHIDLDTYPNVKSYSLLAKSEQELSMQQVKEDQQRLTSDLKAKLDEKSWAALMEQGRAVKAGTLPAAAYYEELERLRDETGLTSADYPQLSNYVGYLKARADLDAGTLLRELVELQRVVFRGLAASDEERMLVRLGEGLDQLKRLIHLQWTPVDYEALQKEPDFMLVPRWLAWLREQDPAITMTDDQADLLQEDLSALTQFYAAAGERDAEMVRRSLEKMDQEKTAIAALVLGGFHTESLSQKFSEQGAEVIVVTPATNEATNEALYHFMLKVKFENGRYLVPDPQSPTGRVLP